jgi:hypothetical protein
MEALALRRLQRKTAGESSVKLSARNGAPITAPSGEPPGSSRGDQSARNKSPAKSVKFGAAGTSVKQGLPVVGERTDQMNTSYGLPVAPKSCHAVGKDGSATVWWTLRTLNPEEQSKMDQAPILKWEILRYRMDKDKVLTGEWKCKGGTVLNVEEVPKLTYTVDGLSNGHQYRFAVRGINSRGEGSASPMSNAVAVDAPLPTGWMRFHDSKTDRMFFANLKTQETCWRRPELDPFFLEEQVLVMFSRREIDHLKELFIEDIAHTKLINEARLVDIGREIGEAILPQKARDYLDEFGTNEDLNPKITKWVEFMNLMYTIKYVKKTPRIPLPQKSLWQMLVKNVFRRKVGTKQDVRMGHW